MENSSFNKIKNLDKMVRADGLDFECKDNIEEYRKVIFEPIRIGPISTLDEMDSKVLQFQNKKLEMKLEEYQRIESELQQRIQQLEKRQTQDKTVLNIVNTLWNQLNDDIGAVLLDVDEEYENDADNPIESETVMDFINELTTWDETQIDEKLMNNVQISTSAMAKIIRAYDHMLLKSDKALASVNLVSDGKIADHTKEIFEPGSETSSDLKLKSKVIDQDKKFQKTYKHEVHSPDHSDVNEIYDKSRKRIKFDESDDTDLHISDSNDESDSIDKKRKKGSIEVFISVTDSKNESTSFTEFCFSKNSDSFNKVTFNSFECESQDRASYSDISSAEINPDRETDDLSDKSLDLTQKDVLSEVKSIISEMISKIEVTEENEIKNQHDYDSKTSPKIFLFDNETVDRLLEGGEKEEKIKQTNSEENKSKDECFSEENEDISDSKDMKDMCAEITYDNVRLQNIISTFQNQQQKMITNEKNITNELISKENEFEEWKARIDDLEYENERIKHRTFKIEHHLTEAVETLEKLKVRERTLTKCDSSASGIKKYEEFEEELELQKELAASRFQELESMRAKYQNNLETIEELEKNLMDLPEELIDESIEYKCLQSQFSVLYNDTILIKDQFEEYHAHIQTLKATFANKAEMTETEDLMTLRKLQTDLLQMQQVNSQLRREYQVLKIEFERNLVANEQTGPLNKEMRHLLTRLQKHNKHLKHEAQRYKRKYKELSAELNVLSKQSYTDSKFKLETEGNGTSEFDETDFGFDVSDEFLDGAVKEEQIDVKNEKMDSGYDDLLDSSLSLYDRPIMAIAIKQEPDLSPPDSPLSIPGPSRCSKSSKKRRDTLQECKEVLNHSNKELQELLEVDDLEDEVFEDENGIDLRHEIKKQETEHKELKLLLDMYKSVNRDKREKSQLIMAEKKLKAEIEDTKAQMRRVLEIKRENRKKLADEDALRKIKYLEEQNFLLLRQINVHKQEEEALLSEMEVTNQAFEDMQEQNSRLIQQLREKDDANSKLMAERIKSNLLYKITREEKESLQVLISATAKQLDSVTTVINELEEKEQVYQTAINNVEKEINLRQQALELHRKKALEHSQSASQLKVNLEKYLIEVKEAKQQIIEQSSAYDVESFKHNRLQEEIDILRQKVERMKKIETPETPDIVLVEEIREYKEMLTCQSCKVRRKDAVLTKCFHVFCWECLRTRYETRQRKCPKCNATFGANDYHRLFFAN